MDDVIQKMFIEEIRMKRHTVNSNRHRSGNSVRKSARKALFLTDIMNRKEKREHTKAGKVECYNMYETILTKDEFFLKDKETQKLMMGRWRDIYSNKKIQDEMGISANATFARIISELELPKKRRGTIGERKKSPKQTPPKQTISQQTLNEMLEEVKVLEEVKAKRIEETRENSDNIMKLITNGLHLEYNGTYDAEQLSKILTKLQLLVEGEPNKFRVSIDFSEITE